MIDYLLTNILGAKIMLINFWLGTRILTMLKLGRSQLETARTSIVAVPMVQKVAHRCKKYVSYLFGPLIMADHDAKLNYEGSEIVFEGEFDWENRFFASEEPIHAHVCPYAQYKVGKSTAWSSGR